ncbi:DUF554 domain-containing protein [Mesoterricola sediminis]|uniref:Membrane protein n=1 Tax=Mesoterricola sediminis TaxID=2927980 RepID=A0AA48H1Y0_9BACT|nr:DUF554 domain-containing protein [Mesoterricola sediminis]BDU78137.1 membrane protein [Mesoterricola sediminis]
MIGPFVNGASVIVGSLTGAAAGNRISENLRTKMPLVFGVSSMGLGIAMIVKVKYLPAVILSLLVGTMIGELLHLEDAIMKLAGKTRGFIDRIAKPADANLPHDEFLSKFVAILVLFCASGTGIFGAMNEGMTGDSSLLMVKSFLDLFTAAIFATALGFSVATLAVPQFIIQSSLFLLATRILPMTSPVMIADFSACGGLIMVATGFRIAGIKPFAVANMLPALFLAMPVTALWVRFFVH